MPLALSPKQARTMGLVPKEKRAPAPRKAAGPNSYVGCGAQGWFFTTVGTGADMVYAWKVVRGTIYRTPVVAAGVGDDLGKHYRPAIEAIVRGEWTEEARS